VNDANKGRWMRAVVQFGLQPGCYKQPDCYSARKLYHYLAAQSATPHAAGV